MAIPRVSSAIKAMIDAEFHKGPQYDIMKLALREVIEENPLVAEFILLHSVHSSDPTKTALCGLLTYRLLNKQDEINSNKHLALNE